MIEIGNVIIYADKMMLYALVGMIVAAVLAIVFKEPIIFQPATVIAWPIVVLFMTVFGIILLHGYIFGWIKLPRKDV